MYLFYNGMKTRALYHREFAKEFTKPVNHWCQQRQQQIGEGVSGHGTRHCRCTLMTCKCPPAAAISNAAREHPSCLFCPSQHTTSRCPSPAAPSIAIEVHFAPRSVSHFTSLTHHAPRTGIFGQACLKGCVGQRGMEGIEKGFPIRRSLGHDATRRVMAIESYLEPTS